MAFKLSRVQEAVIPEAGGIVVGAGLEMVAAIVDDKTDWERPYVQYGATAVNIMLPAYLIGTARYTEFSKGMLYLGLGMVVMNFGRAISQKALRKPVQSRMIDFAAMIPQQVVSTRQIGGGSPPPTGGSRDTEGTMVGTVKY